ncbi:hypothetical protein [Caldimonas taiwanensis]|uniref:hypothetical protein n=1 Tax=Caldimonas taiwanensis TaxID=307483 RepID=UPI000782DA88|nr:hypothetical protein [Caldimonas taiwanensis]
MIVLAVDIGLSGALAAVDHRHTCVVHDLVTVAAEEASTKPRRRLCGRSLAQQIRQIVPPGEAATLVIEDVQARPMGNGGRHGNAIQTQGSLMRSRGIVEGAADVLRLPLKVVQPQTWKRRFGLLGKDKRESLEVARRLFPAAQSLLARQKDHNRAECLLIALWGQMELA